MTTPESNDVARLATEFVARLRDTLTVAKWDLMRLRNATPTYAGDVCASQDFCDANEVMLAAFEDVFEREMVWPCDVDEGAAPEDQERDFALWNAAWAFAKSVHLTAPPSEPYEALRYAMSQAFQVWTASQGPEFLQGDASELLFLPDLTPAQRQYLNRFVNAWEALDA